MRQMKRMSRAQQRQELLRELASEEVVHLVSGRGHSRAVEAVEALRRIREGNYGRCTDCGERIRAARLRAKPEATRCITCQSNYEGRLSAHTADWDHASKRSA